MDNALLFNEIESLPDALRQQVADFVEFLKYKYSGGALADDLEFSEAELEELDRRWDEYDTAPDEAVDSEIFKMKIREKYGV